MVSAMSADVFHRVRDSLQGWTPPRRSLRMADGSIVPSLAHWTGQIRLGNLQREGSFEVFDSKGSWSFLFGKPLLQAFSVVHDYSTDTVELPGPTREILPNKSKTFTWDAFHWEKRESLMGGESPPSRAVLAVTQLPARNHHDIDTAPLSTLSDEDSHSHSSPTRTSETGKSRGTLVGGISPPSREVPAHAITELPSGQNSDTKPFDSEAQDPSAPNKIIAIALDGLPTPEIGETRGTLVGGVIPPSREVLPEYPALAFAQHAKKSSLPAFTSLPPASAETALPLPLGETRETLVGGATPPSREVLTRDAQLPFSAYVDKPLASAAPTVFLIDESDSDVGTEIPTENLTGEARIFCRAVDPFRHARVERVLRDITVGSDLTVEQHACVIALLREFADCFALSVSEVHAVPNAIFHLNVPPDASLPKKVHQRRLTPPQKVYLNSKIDEMLAADIISPGHPNDVKCVSPTTLAQKAHAHGGLSRDELLHRINDQCVAAGLPSLDNLPPRPAPDTQRDEKSPTKWRICQNYGALNKVTEIAPMPQGDIRSKQQLLSGHRWISTFDFASGFYAVTVDEESRPYTCFYVEGRGFFQYKRMPFGLTGAPSTFAQLTAEHLHDLLSDGTMELFVDDGATAGDTFEHELSKLRRIFTRIRERKLSLSASKSTFFASTAIFAGANISRVGVSPDSAKLTAIVDWPQPPNALNLYSFLGLTAHFRDLIKGYALIEKPLRDLLKEVNLPPGYSKSLWRSIHEKHTFDGRWFARHTKAFLELKRILTTEPVLRCPKWDGTPFVVTSDGCKEGFGAVLTQRFETTLPDGTVVVRRFPVGFASKRTSRTEMNYKPFLLEFAALKFALDKFSDTIWGFPLEIETDCSALRDVLSQESMNPAHARWRDGIIAHNIIDVRHVPGKINVVADGISRRDEGKPRTDADGSSWSVSPDWEVSRGIVQDVLLTSVEEDSLRARFKDEPLFLSIIDAIQDVQSSKSDREQQRAKHRATQYLIYEGKLWRLNGGDGSRALPRTECVSRKEALALATKQHADNGHWGRDAIKIALLNKIHSPRLDESIVTAIRECSQCKSFGPTHLHSLLMPITRRHPFELLVGDYLSLPNGKGGYHTVGLFLDTYSQHVWAFKFKSAGTAKTTIDCLANIFHNFIAPETFMSDGGKHFDNQDVRDFCAKRSTKHHVIAAYAPWINGLVEGTNKLLLHVLKRLCAPDLDNDDLDAIDWDKLPKQWPDHLDEAVRCLNNRLLPSFKFSPKELLLGLVINTPKTPLEESCSVLRVTDVDTQAAYAAQQRLDGYSAAVIHALKRKEAFDRRVTNSNAGHVVFEVGQLVQVYHSRDDFTFKSSRKIIPRWSVPRRVVERLQNSYRLETMKGVPVPGLVHARRLRAYSPREGSHLAKEIEDMEDMEDMEKVED